MDAGALGRLGNGRGERIGRCGKHDILALQSAREIARVGDLELPRLDIALRHPFETLGVAVEHRYVVVAGACEQFSDGNADLAAADKRNVLHGSLLPLIRVQEM